MSLKQTKAMERVEDVGKAARVADAAAVACGADRKWTEKKQTERERERKKKKKREKTNKTENREREREQTKTNKETTHKGKGKERMGKKRRTKKHKESGTSFGRITAEFEKVKPAPLAE